MKGVVFSHRVTSENVISAGGRLSRKEVKKQENFLIRRRQEGPHYGD